MSKGKRVKFTGVFRTQSSIYNGAFFLKYLTASNKKSSQKSSIEDVRLGSKYISETEKQIEKQLTLLNSFKHEYSFYMDQMFALLDTSKEFL